MAADKRAEVVKVAKSREKKNQYTQGAKRTQVGLGWSDCSSFVRWCYLQVLGSDIGGNTAAQIVNKKLGVVDSAGGKYPAEKKLLPGDLIYYKGTDKSRPYQVGHVELYISGGKIIGHGSGVGPTIKDMKTYSSSRYSQGKGYIRTLRVIPADEGQSLQDTSTIIPADPMQSTDRQIAPEHGVRITEKQVNIRVGPGTSYGIAKVGKQGEVYESADITGWRPILSNGEVSWVSEKMSEVI